MVMGHYPLAFVPARVAFTDMLSSLFNVAEPAAGALVAFTLLFVGSSLATALVVRAGASAGAIAPAITPVIAPTNAPASAPFFLFPARTCCFFLHAAAASQPCPAAASLGLTGTGTTKAAAAPGPHAQPCKQRKTHHD